MAARRHPRRSRVEGGWRLTGTKSYVTNGAVADLAVVTAVTDPDGPRTGRLSMFLVDLRAPEGVRRTRLNKQVWVPSDLTRLELRGRVRPATTTCSAQRGPRPAAGAADLHPQPRRDRRADPGHGRRRVRPRPCGSAASAHDLRPAGRRLPGQVLRDRRAARGDRGRPAHALEGLLEGGPRRGVPRRRRRLAKYLSGGRRHAGRPPGPRTSSAPPRSMREHPIHKFPMDAWGASLGEGTQDVQKLIIFRELMKHIKSKDVLRFVFGIWKTPCPEVPLRGQPQAPNLYGSKTIFPNCLPSSMRR
ncbi:MAG: acyl-CoA dehydrogenase family protein [Desulfobacterales bacterium]|nr:acyl-CoA dehydrogenase family protein [Desulfobacterales bacterium]